MFAQGGTAKVDFDDCSVCISIFDASISGIHVMCIHNIYYIMSEKYEVLTYIINKVLYYLRIGITLFTHSGHVISRRLYLNLKLDGVADLKSIPIKQLRRHERG